MYLQLIFNKCCIVVEDYTIEESVETTEVKNTNPTELMTGAIKIKIDEDWPGLAAIYYKQKKGLGFICAGTLVSTRHIITGITTVATTSLCSNIGTK